MAKVAMKSKLVARKFEVTLVEYLAEGSSDGFLTAGGLEEIISDQLEQGNTVVVHEVGKPKEI